MSFRAPVAVTGLGCLCAAGNTLGECTETLFSGRRAPSPPGRFSTTHPVSYPVFEVPEAALAGSAAEEAGLLRTSRLALASAREAVADAGWSSADLAALRVGVCVGTTVGSAMNNEDFYRQYREGGRPEMTPIERFLQSNPAAAISRAYTLSGPCQTVVNACASGTDAIGLAASWIRAGLCDLAIAGGADELCRVTYNGFISLMIADTEPVRPFDSTRRGLNLGEGAAMLILESEALRREKKGRARAFVLGYGSACDAYHLTAPSPEGTGLRRAIEEALATSGVAAAEIAFVNAHGTGTPDNDRVESRVLCDALPQVPFFSTKGYTGHTLGAAGAIEAALTVACLERREIPASVGFSLPDPDLPGRPTEKAVAIRGRVALSESLAFGGNNAVIVFGSGDNS
jgi:3-oxoacyl-[acyl-carrier-protein] synthase-1/3-oxoacyl-[acyl-carrier-protein] synthase II